MLRKIPYLLSAFFIFTFFSQIRPLTADDNREKTTRLRTLLTITNLTQAAIWLNEEELAVGRWDGTITIFNCKNSLSILQALVPPKKQGITMLEKMDDCTFVSSNGSSSIAIWRHGHEGYFLRNTYNFNDCFSDPLIVQGS